MKIIFSRKGFDSASGGMASPILPDGSLCWLPIPEEGGNFHYSDIRHGLSNLGDVVSQLSAERLTPDTTAHLDPDIWSDYIPHSPVWRPIFGQCGAAQSHLENQGVQNGDIFLFYGWFRHTECRNGRLVFQKADSGRHILFAWMQIGQIIPVIERSRVPSWANHHAHIARKPVYKNDTIYLANDELVIHGKTFNRAGYGCFLQGSEEQVLTQSGETRSVWRLPQWFYPDGKSRKPMSYHSDPDRWTSSADGVTLRTVARGQEFVLNCDDYPEAMDWVISLIGREEYWKNKRGDQLVLCNQISS